MGTQEAQPLGLSILVYKTEEKPLSCLQLHRGHSPSVTQCCPHIKDYHHYYNQYGAVIRVMSSCVGVYAQKLLRVYGTPVVLSLGELLGAKSGRGLVCTVYSSTMFEHFYQIYFIFPIIKRDEDTVCK